MTLLRVTDRGLYCELERVRALIGSDEEGP